MKGEWIKMDVPSAKPFFKEEDIENILGEIREVLKSGRLILGPKAQELEETFADYIGVKHAIAVNSCTSALELVLRYINVRDSEVIVPTNTFIASSNAVIYAGGKPILADIKRETLCIDPEDVLERITRKTKAIIVVHLAGLICPQMKELSEICADHNLVLIEDAAHAHGATVEGKKAGSLGDFGCFSFYPTKVMTTGVGGMITMNDANLLDFAKSVRHHGQGKDLTQIENLGNDWVMSEVTAVLGIYQLKWLEECLKKRNETAQKYTQGLKNIGCLTPITVLDTIRHSYYKYPALISDGIDTDASKLEKLLKEKYNIATGTLYYPPVHLQPIYKRIFGYTEGMLPVAEAVLKRELCLPMFVEIDDEAINYVIESLENELL